jgi:hypothetical protein
MSGLEVFALVASIFQVISFAGETIKLCNAAYNGAAPDRRLAEMAAAMDSVSAEIETQCKKAPDATSDAERELLALAAECGKTARAVKENANQFDKSQTKERLGASVLATLRYQFRRPAYKKLENQLENQRKTLETKLLARTWSVPLRLCSLAVDSRHRQRHTNWSLLVHEYKPTQSYSERTSASSTNASNIL